MTEKFFSIKPLGSQIRAGQKILKAADYQQLESYDSLVAGLEKNYRRREEAMAVAMGKAIRRGLDEGRARANREASEKMTLFAGRVGEVLSHVEAQLVDVVSEAVRKVIDDLGQEERVRQAVLSGLELVRGSHNLVIRVHPSMQTNVSEQLDDIPHRFTNLEVVGDDSLAEDECTLESDLGIVNAGLEQQLRVIEQVLLEVFAEVVAE